jgi:hypothetical protein
MVLDNFLLIFAISEFQATRTSIPATRRSSVFQVRTNRLFRSIDSRSTVGMTDGVEICAFRAVAVQSHQSYKSIFRAKASHFDL